MPEKLSKVKQLELYIGQNPQETRNISEKVVGYVELLELQVEILTEDNHQLTSELIQMEERPRVGVRRKGMREDERIPTPKPKPTSATLPSFLKCRHH